MTRKRSPELPSDAAEHALGLLSGEALRKARARVASDPAFALEVARWNGRFAPLADEIEPTPAPGMLWSRIERSLGTPSDNSNVITLNRRVTIWRGFAGGMTAIAASLAVVLLMRPEPFAPPAPTPALAPAPAPSASTPMVAMLGDEDKQIKLVASWTPDRKQLVLAVAGNIASDKAHSNELWVIPAGGAPRSLGTMPNSKQMHMQLTDQLAEFMREGATIAVSTEPRGGSPSGAPTGPVVASGPLSAA